MAMERVLSPMTEADLDTALAAELQDAVSYCDEEIGPLRAAATHYYQARPFGDEEDGRSQIVMPITRDTVRATLPSLMRIFFGSQRVVEFSAGTPNSGDFAEDATHTVNYVFSRQNPGYEVAWAAFKDALVRKSGWIKWWWDDAVTVSYRTFSGVLEEQLMEAQASLEQYEQLEVLEKVQVGEIPPQQIGERPVVGYGSMGELVETIEPVMSPAQPIYEYKIQIVCKKSAGRVRVAAVPPDEILVCRDATGAGAARLIAHRTRKTRGELVAMGIDPALLEDIPNDAYDPSTNEEVIARQPTETTVPDRAQQLTWDQVKLPYYECYYVVDFDGDGISELRKVCKLGINGVVTHNEPVDEVPLALFCPDPEPHVIFGLSQADYVMDLQLIYSHIWRDILDSLKQSIFPRTAYVEGQVNVDDVLNTEIGAAIRMRQPGMVQPLEIPFTGEKAFGLVSMLEEVREQRTGIKNAALTTDANTLQSTTQVAAAAAVTASQAQVELIARIFAETGMKRVFAGILRLLTRHQNTKMQFKLNGRTFNVNPAEWDPDMETVVNTALGTGTQDQKIAVLAALAQTQKEVLTSLGEGNPLCSLQEFYNTQVSMLELVGFRDTHRFWKDPKPAIEAAMAEGRPVIEPQPSPEQVIAEAQVAIEEAKAAADALKIILEDDRERDKNEADMILRAHEIMAKYGTQIDVASIKALMDRERNDAKQATASQAE